MSRPRGHKIIITQKMDSLLKLLSRKKTSASVTESNSSFRRRAQFEHVYVCSGYQIKNYVKRSFLGELA
jgi:hypothetical protein